MASPAPMPSETTARPHVEIAHVLFIDVVDYSMLLINEQQQIQQELNQVVRGTEQFRIAEGEGRLTRLPTGDGMALVFFTTPEAPVQCALEISEALRSYPRLKLRMGVHSGPISSTTDVNDRSNIAGAAINIAERIMSCGDAGHILLSKRVAEDLGQYVEWQPCLHDLGEIEVKHGLRLDIVNLYTDKLGNPELPQKIKEARQAKTLRTERSATQDSASSGARGFFEEVQRRKVYRVAVAYIVVAGGLIQLASAVFPAWELPSWSLRLVVMLLLTGFPIGLILAWAFDVTPEGIRATPPLNLASPRRRGRRNLLILLAAGVLISGLAGLFILPRASARRLDKSIAVLPFENFSDSKENAFFADGIQDDILTTLAKISDLKVISRTSVMPYRGKASSAREIGKALGVSAILEGSVRKDGNRVRVNVQLINAANDEHLWAEDYDRDLTDMFAIQTDLAQKIAKELQAKLSPSEKEQLTRKPTENGEAYLAFVQARNLQNAYEDIEKLKQAEQLYERAIQLDPKFALALAGFSQLESWIVHSFERTAPRKEKARTLAERALQLAPDLPEAHLALGYSYYYGDLNYDDAEKEFAIAQKGLPNDSEVLLSVGAIQRRRGKWAESTANLEKAASLDPKSSWPLQNLAFNYEMTRDYAKANETVDRALAIDPKSFPLSEMKCMFAIQEKGDFTPVEKALVMFESLPKDADKNGKIAGARVNILLLQHKFAEALRAAESLSDDASGWEMSAYHSKNFFIGVAKKGVGDEVGARAAFLKAKAIAEKAVAEAPDDAGRHAQLGMILACLSEKDAALTEAKRATELLPESKDAFDGPQMTENLAQVYAILGDADPAIDILDGLLTRPSIVTVEMLKLNPVWDRIRSNPRFAELLSKHGAKT
jgi:TolB-like protein/class 3 adenylate cyclase/Tfp pilus assembly protein PilF